MDGRSGAWGGCGGRAQARTRRRTVESAALLLPPCPPPAPAAGGGGTGVVPWTRGGQFGRRAYAGGVRADARADGPLQGGHASPSRRHSSPQSRGAVALAGVLHADVHKLRRARIPQRARHSCGCPAQRRLRQEEEEEEEALEPFPARGLVRLPHAGNSIPNSNYEMNHPAKLWDAPLRFYVFLLFQGLAPRGCQSRTQYQTHRSSVTHRIGLASRLC
jgi:hypothetical protein